MFRISVVPNTDNGLRQPSAVMVDKVSSVPIAHVGAPLGRLDPVTMAAVDNALRLWLGL